MKVEIWSDIACPWCYIGRRRFEGALTQFEHHTEVEVIWRSYQLDPNAPREYAGTVNEMLMQRYGIGRAQAEQMNARVTALAAEEGLDFRIDRSHPVNSLDAHRLLHLAAHHHLQGEMKERLQRAYFTEGLVISDHETLVQLAVDVGLDAGETRRMLAGDAYAAEVRVDARRAQALGSNGVPFFVFDERYAVAGAQPTGTFLIALERTWTDLHKVSDVVDTGREAGVGDEESSAV